MILTFFWPTHLISRRHHLKLNMTSSCPHTHAPFYRFFSLAIANLLYDESPWLWLLHRKKCSYKKRFFKKIPTFFSAPTKKVFSLYILWSCQHLATPTHLFIKHHHLAIPPIHLFDDIILEWSLSNLTFKKNIFPHKSNKLCYVSIIRVIETEYAMKFPSTLLAYYFCLSLLWDWLCAFYLQIMLAMKKRL